MNFKDLLKKKIITHFISQSLHANSYLFYFIFLRERGGERDKGGERRGKRERERKRESEREGEGRKRERVREKGGEIVKS